jgi:membrane-associated phospholipid phosphatase
MRPTILGTVLLTLTSAATLPAQVTFKHTGYEFRDGLTDVLHIWTSPFHASRQDWLAALAVAAGAAVLVPIDDQVDSWIVRHPSAAVVRMTDPWNERHPEFGDLSTGKRLLPISGALIVAGMVSDNRKLREAGWGCLSAWQASSTLRTLLYETVSRERPATANGDQYDVTAPGGEWDQHSFIGGHAANAVACATFWSSRFEMGVLEPVLYAGALGISLSRMADRRHWASDTWVGVVTGYAIGRSVAARYARRESVRERKNMERQPIPASFLDGLNIGPAPGGLSLTWSGQFR